MIQRMQSPLSELFSELLLQMNVIVSISRIEMRILDFSARDVLEPFASICNRRSSFRRMSSLERRPAKNISFLQTLQLAPCEDTPKSCQ